MSEANPAAAEMVRSADTTQALERLRAGEVFVELLHDGVASRAAGLDALLGQIDATDTKLIWISNPLRSPLTIERVFLQAAGPEADLRVERTPEELAAILQSTMDGTARALLIVHQPETLDAEARDTLAAIAPWLENATPTVQFLFCGKGAFRPITAARVAAPTQPSIAFDRPLTATTCLAYETIPQSPPLSTARLLRILLLVVAILCILMTASITNKPAPSPHAAKIAPISAAQPQQPDDVPPAALQSQHDTLAN